MQIAPFELEQWMNKYEQSIKYNIGESGIAPLSMGELLSYMNDKGNSEINALMLGYNDVSGSLLLRKEIAQIFEHCQPEQVLITTGAIEANYLVFNVLLNPGDHVIAPYPAYQQLFAVPQAIGCNVSFWHCGPEQNFEFSLAELQKIVRKDTKLIVVNSPHNPTGATFSTKELQEICDLAKSVGAIVLSDEAYRWLSSSGASNADPAAFSVSDNAISIGTMSKAFGVPGLRIGWIVGSQDIINRCRSMRHYISLCPGTLSDALALIALRNKEKIFQRNQNILATNLNVLTKWVESRSDFLSFKPPKAGPLVMLKYGLDISSIELGHLLATKYSVLAPPGALFGTESFLRICFGQQPAIFQQALEQLDRCILELVKEKAYQTTA